MKRAGIFGLLALAAMAVAGGAHAQGSADVDRALALLNTDPAGARAILEPAAEAGDADAMYTLAAMLAAGRGGEAAPAAAREWYSRAAAKGAARATRALGMMTFTGEGGDANPAMGVALLQLAAEAGDENAELLLSLVREDEYPGDEAVALAREEFLNLHPKPDPAR